MLCRIPVDECSAQRRRPLQLKIRSEERFHFERLLGFDFQQDHCAWLVGGNRERLPNPKIVSCIEEGRRFRTNRERARQTLGWKRPVADMEDQVKVAKDLQRINPRLEVTGLVPEQASPRTDHRQKFPRSDRARQFDFRRTLLGGGGKNRYQADSKERAAHENALQISTADRTRTHGNISLRKGLHRAGACKIAVPCMKIGRGEF